MTEPTIHRSSRAARKIRNKNRLSDFPRRMIHRHAAAGTNPNTIASEISGESKTWFATKMLAYTSARVKRTAKSLFHIRLIDTKKDLLPSVNETRLTFNRPGIHIGPRSREFS